MEVNKKLKLVNDQEIWNNPLHFLKVIIDSTASRPISRRTGRITASGEASTLQEEALNEINSISRVRGRSETCKSIS